MHNFKHYDLNNDLHIYCIIFDVLYNNLHNGYIIKFILICIMISIKPYIISEWLTYQILERQAHLKTCFTSHLNSCIHQGLQLLIHSLILVLALFCILSCLVFLLYCRCNPVTFIILALSFSLGQGSNASYLYLAPIYFLHQNYECYEISKK